jgi:hypothetical protein
MRNAGNVITWLREAVNRLADTSENQIAWFIEKRLPADELALEFSDWAGLVPQLVEAGQLSPDAGIAIDALDRQLVSMSGKENAALWEDEALRDSAEWAKVRELAMAACLTLPEPTAST